MRRDGYKIYFVARAQVMIRQFDPFVSVAEFLVPFVQGDDGFDSQRLGGLTRRRKRIERVDLENGINHSIQVLHDQSPETMRAQDSIMKEERRISLCSCSSCDM